MRSSSTCALSGFAASEISCFRTSKTGCSISFPLLIPIKRSALGLKYATCSAGLSKMKPLRMFVAISESMKYSRAKLDDINVDSSLEVEIVCAIVYSSKQVKGEVLTSSPRHKPGDSHPHG